MRTISTQLIILLSISTQLSENEKSNFLLQMRHVSEIVAFHDFTLPFLYDLIEKKRFQFGKFWLTWCAIIFSVFNNVIWFMEISYHLIMLHLIILFTIIWITVCPAGAVLRDWFDFKQFSFLIYWIHLIRIEVLTNKWKNVKQNWNYWKVIELFKELFYAFISIQLFSGLIGHSWSMIFASYGFDVYLYDIISDNVDKAIESIKTQLFKLQNGNILRGYLTAEQQISHIHKANTLVECVSDAIHVQVRFFFVFICLLFGICFILSFFPSRNVSLKICIWNKSCFWNWTKFVQTLWCFAAQQVAFCPLWLQKKWITDHRWLLVIQWIRHTFCHWLK